MIFKTSIVVFSSEIFSIEKFQVFMRIILSLKRTKLLLFQFYKNEPNDVKTEH